MKLGDETAGQPAPAESAAAPRKPWSLKPWRTPVVILETVSSQTARSQFTGSDASATPFTLS